MIVKGNPIGNACYNDITLEKKPSKPSEFGMRLGGNFHAQMWLDANASIV